MKNIYIKTEHGHMIIYADQFFPCSQKRFKKLLSIIKEFSYLNNVQEISEQLTEAITKQLEYLEWRYKTKKKKSQKEISVLKKFLEMLESLKV